MEGWIDRQIDKLWIVEREDIELGSKNKLNSHRCEKKRTTEQGRCSQRERERERERDRQTDRQSQTETVRQRQRDRERE